jgi:transcriptional regulator GlxA family with amidase domain
MGLVYDALPDGWGMLLRTSRPIKQVAEAAGFLNEKSFIRAFKGWTGKAPGEFRGGTAGEV